MIFHWYDKVYETFRYLHKCRLLSNTSQINIIYDNIEIIYIVWCVPQVQQKKPAQEADLVKFAVKNGYAKL